MLFVFCAWFEIWRWLIHMDWGRLSTIADSQSEWYRYCILLLWSDECRIRIYFHTRASLWSPLTSLRVTLIHWSFKIKSTLLVGNKHHLPALDWSIKSIYKAQSKSHRTIMQYLTFLNQSANSSANRISIPEVINRYQLSYTNQTSNGYTNRREFPLFSSTQS